MQGDQIEDVSKIRQPLTAGTSGFSSTNVGN